MAEADNTKVHDESRNKGDVIITNHFHHSTIGSVAGQMNDSSQQQAKLGPSDTEVVPSPTSEVVVSALV